MFNRDISFSLWLDFIERNFLENEFRDLIDSGIINGATSNPAIFANAITTSQAYKEQLIELEGLSAKEKYEAIAIKDIKRAAQLLRPLYDDGNDGYISIEVDPALCHDANGTFEEGKRLFKTIDEPNVMIKVPATDEGYGAMTRLMEIGIPVNATLIFSPAQAKECLKAMKIGINNWANYGGGLVQGVVSVFVSRFDRELDASLEEKGIEVSKTGIYNAGKIYRMIERNHTPSIRALFASTGVKGDTLPTDYYVRELFGSRLVNTAPLETIMAYTKNPENEAILPLSSKVINDYFKKLEDNGICMDTIYAKLLEDGLKAFIDSFDAMLSKIK